MSTDREQRREYYLNQLKSNLRPLCDQDDKWNQLFDEVSRQVEEYNRLGKEKNELETTLTNTLTEDDRKRKQQDLEIVTAKRNIAGSKEMVAFNQRYQRECELDKSLLEDGDPNFADIEAQIKWHQGYVQDWEKVASQRQKDLDKLMSEKNKDEEEAENKRILDEFLKEGSVNMRYMVCITEGLPGTGKTCLKLLLMGLPPPGLRSSTILAEAPIRIEIRKISEAKLQATGERWIEVTNEEMLEIVARMIIHASQQHPGSRIFQEMEEASGVVEEIRDTGIGSKMERKRANPLTWFLRKIRKRKAPTLTDAKDAGVLSQRQANIPSEACQKAVNEIKARLVQIITRLRQSDDSAIQHSGCDVPNYDWVLHSDCGGQPEYHDLLPLFIRYVSAVLCVIRLPDKLDEVQAVEYYCEDELVGVAQQSRLTAKDTLRCLVNTTQSFSSETEKPKIIIVGTHRDVLEEKVKEASKCHALASIETLQDKNQILLEILEPDFSDQLVRHHNDQLIFPLNTLNPGEEDQAIATLIRKAVENSTAKETQVPIWWYIFELLLQELARHLGRKVLSKAECLEIANMLGFDERALEAALSFFDQLNVIKYSPKVLPHVVFTDSQVPLDKVSELVREAYLLRGGQSALFEQLCSPLEVQQRRHFRDHGVVSHELMKKFPRHYEPGIFTEHNLSLLFKDMLVFAEIPTPSWVQPQPKDASKSTQKKSEPYFVMPSSMVTLSEAELEKHRPFSRRIATLLVKFPPSSRRAAVFSCFAVHLIRHCGWDLLLDAKVPLYRNCIEFYLKKMSPPCRVTAIDSHKFIEVHARICADATDQECARLLPVLKGAVFGGVFAACRALNFKQTNPEMGFICPHKTDSTTESQKAKLHSASLTSNNEFWCCDVDSEVSGRLENCHRIWLGSVRDGTSSVSPVATYQSSPQDTSRSKPQLSSTTLSAVAKPTYYSASSSVAQPHVALIPPGAIDLRELSAASNSHLSPPIKSSASRVTSPATGSTSDAASVYQTAKYSPASASTHLPHVPEMTVCVSTRKTEDLSRLSTASPTTQLTSHSSTTSAPLVPYISDSASISSTTVSHPSPSFATASKSSPSQSPVSGVYSNSSPSSGHDNSSKLSPRTVSKFSPCSDSDRIVIPPLPESMKSHSTPSSDNQECASISASTNAKMPTAAASDSHLSPSIKSSASRVTSPATGSTSDVASVIHTAKSTPTSASSYSQLTSGSSTVSAPLVPYISDSAAVLSTSGSHPSPYFTTGSKSPSSQSLVSGVHTNSSPSSGHDNSSMLLPHTVSPFSDSDKIVIPPLSERRITPLSSRGEECASISVETSAQMPTVPLADVSDSHLSPPIKSSASRVTSNSPATGSNIALESITGHGHSTPSSDLEGKECASISAERSTLLSKDSLGTGDLANILQAAWKARVEWYNIGLALRISSNMLDVIKSENHHVVKDCFREMLKEWLKSEPPPTWTELVKALKSPIVEYEELAEALTHRPY